MRNDSHVTIDWTWENQTGEGGIPAAIYEFRLETTVTPGEPQMYDSPGCGPMCEITRVSLERVTTETETHTALSEPRRLEIDEAAERWLDSPAGVYVLAGIEERCYAQAEKNAIGRREAAEEAWTDARRELMLIDAGED